MPDALRHRPRLLAALVFGGAGLLLPTLWFLPVIGPSHNAVVLTLYIGLPGLAAAVAGAIGEPWLDPARCRSGGRAVARGAGIAAGALVVFAPLLALGLKWTEPGWTNPLGLTALILWFSLVAVGWAVALVGGVAGWLVWRWRQRTASAVDTRSAKA
jgi:hypothetical protein